MEWLMEDTTDAQAGVSLARMTVEPGAISQAHRHPNCSEVVHLLAGRVQQRLDNHWVTLNAGDTLLIPAGAVHQTRNRGDEQSVLMIAYSSGARIYEPVD
jgi:quercetin dioxygenase-like cupin family protein